MTSNSKPVLNIHELTLRRWRLGAVYQSGFLSFGALLGLKDIGIRYNEVPAKKIGCPFHNHHIEEELFYIIAGEGEYRFGPDRFPVKAGDVLGAPAGGQDTAHQLINTGTVPLAYLAISTKAKAEIIEYPDSGKFLAKVAGTDTEMEFEFIGRQDDAVDYWDGEPGA